ncbi:MAG: helix-turn-helix domain-containing protein [Desulfovibrionaceae bacterium]
MAYSNQNFGEKLRSLREELGISRDVLAERLSVSRSSLQNYEEGSLPKGDVLIRIAQELNCSTDWLLLGVEPQIVAPQAGQCQRCAQLDEELRKEREANRELSTEVRRLLVENGDLRVKVVELKARVGPNEDGKELRQAG